MGAPLQDHRARPNTRSLLFAILGQAPGGAGVKRGVGAGAKKVQGVPVELPVQIIPDFYEDGQMF